MDDPENKQKVPFMFVEEEDILGFKDQPVPQDQGQVKVVLEEAENKALYVLLLCLKFDII